MERWSLTKARTVAKNVPVDWAGAIDDRERGMVPFIREHKSLQEAIALSTGSEGAAARVALDVGQREVVQRAPAAVITAVPTPRPSLKAVTRMRPGCPALARTIARHSPLKALRSG
jgi:hypothetical protein